MIGALNSRSDSPRRLLVGSRPESAAIGAGSKNEAIGSLAGSSAGAPAPDCALLHPSGPMSVAAMIKAMRIDLPMREFVERSACMGVRNRQSPRLTAGGKCDSRF